MGWWWNCAPGPVPGMFSGVEVGQPGVRLGTSGQDA